MLIDERLEAVETGGVMTEGPRRRLAVMVKDRGCCKTLPARWPALEDR